MKSVTSLLFPLATLLSTHDDDWFFCTGPLIGKRATRKLEPSAAAFFISPNRASARLYLLKRNDYSICFCARCTRATSLWIPSAAISDYNDLQSLVVCHFHIHINIYAASSSEGALKNPTSSLPIKLCVLFSIASSQ